VIEALRPIAERIRERGGRAVVVGGFVRDRLLGRVSKDLDVEVFGLGAPQLEAVLSGFGPVRSFGRSFGVRQIGGLAADFALPRGEPAPGGDFQASFAAAARRRDLTVNAIGLDPLSDEILDPLGGRADLAARVLRAADARHFGEDPLRGLRVVQLAARFEMEPDAELLELCRALDLDGVPGERLGVEFDKLLLAARRPSRGLAVLSASGLRRFFPELEALEGVPQDPTWHPEGDVWTHTLLSLDAAAQLRAGGEEGAPDDVAALMYAVLCHDFGKPATTTRERDGRIRSRGHEAAGLDPARRFLERLRAPTRRVSRVLALVEHHLAPALLPAGGATARAYRRLARKLVAAEVSPALLERVARADHWGRTTAEAIARTFAAGDRFLAAFASLSETGPHDVVQGRHLLARGYAPGPQLGALLERCRDVQDATGWSDPDAILARVLAEPREDESGDR